MSGTPSRYVLDTHVWIWMHTDPKKLSPAVVEVLEKPNRYDALVLPAISIWELCKLAEKGRLILSCEVDTWIQMALRYPGLRVAELSPEIAYESTRLPPSFHEDPADQMIVATARAENAVLITKDRRLRDYPHVRTLW